MIDLLNASEQEIRDWFLKDILEDGVVPEWRRRFEELKRKIDNDFQVEWSKQHFKWFFKKRRQKKLKAKIWHRHTGPIFYTLEEMIDELWTQSLSDNSFFDRFIGIKNIKGDTSDWYAFDEPELVVYTSDRIIRNAIADEKEEKDD